jgi:uncharacterized peroxidase-related enzyme
MSRLAVPTRDDAPAQAKPVLDSLFAEFGFVPSLYRMMAQSPAALAAYAGLRQALNPTLDPKTREAVALAVAQVHGCGYGLSVHSYAALNFAELPPYEIAANRAGSSANLYRAAAAKFARRVAETRGQVGNEEISAVRVAGLNDAQIVELISLAALTAMASLLSHVGEPEIDFPRVGPEK